MTAVIDARRASAAIGPAATDAPGVRPGAGVDPIRPARTVAHDGYSVLVCRPDGSIGDEGGLFDLDTRILSRHRLELDGRPFQAIGATIGEGPDWSATLVARRSGGRAEGPQLPQDAWAARLTRRVGCGMAERIELTNHSMVEGRATLTIALAADFADQLGSTGRQPARDTTVGWFPSSAELLVRSVAEHEGRSDERGLSVRVTGRPPTASGDADGADGREASGRTLEWAIEVGPRETWTVELEYASFADGRWRHPDDALGRDALRSAWNDSRTYIEASDDVVAPAFERAAADLLALRNWELEPSADGSSWVPNAGVPSFTGFFGRDALTAGYQAAMLGPEPLRGALEIAARTQGTRAVPWTEEEPGRMVHEMRRGPLAALGIRPHARYYGSQTTGSMFVLALSELWHWTGDDAIVRRHLGAARRAIDWAETLGDLDGDGFMEYVKRSADGLKNQGWKDSDEAIRYPDGTIVDNPVATVEEQAFHFLALQRLAELLVALDEEPEAVSRLLARAAELAARWHEAYWLPSERFYALALDPAKAPVATIASNPGHALAVGIVPPEHAVVVADRLLEDELFSGWGVRTLSRDHPSYNPLAYHLGAVWPVENATIALGFKRYGLDDHLDRLLEAMFRSVAACRDLRLPEALAGYDRSETPVPVPYPGGNSPQAWSASAVVQAVQIMLGLYPFAAAGILGIVRPRLPAWLPSLTVRRLRVGDAVVDIRFERRDDGSADVEVLERSGSLRVVPAPPPDDVGDGMGLRERLTAWALEHAPGRTARALRIALGDLETEA
jgi:glycogen debranching enzyme